MKLWKKLILGVFAVLLIMGIFVFQKMQLTMEYANAYQAEELHMYELADGRYEGSSLWGLVTVRLQVEILDHRIQDIRLLEHVNGMGEPAEAIIPEIIKANSCTIDVISGATISSKAIQNAVQTALQEAVQHKEAK